MDFDKKLVLKCRVSSLRMAFTYYSIIKDYTNLDGKRTTKIYEKLGNQEQVEERFGKINTLEKIKIILMN